MPSDKEIAAELELMEAGEPLRAKLPGKLESARRGFTQGATAGWGEEITAALSAPILKAIGKLSGNPAYQEAFGQKPIGDLYREGRDRERAENATAQAANPWTYGGANVAGGLWSSFVPGLGMMNVPKGAKVGTGVARGALQGGVTGLGTSEAEDLQGLAKDTGMGMGLGAVTGPLAAKGKAVTAGVVGGGSAGFLGTDGTLEERLEGAGRGALVGGGTAVGLKTGMGAAKLATGTPLRKAGGRRMTAALKPSPQDVRRVDERPGGREKFGEDLYDTLKPTVADSAEKLLTKAELNRDKKYGPQVGTMVKAASREGASVPGKVVMDRLRGVAGDADPFDQPNLAAAMQGMVGRYDQAFRGRPPEPFKNQNRAPSAPHRVTPAPEMARPPARAQAPAPIPLSTGDVGMPQLRPPQRPALPGMVVEKGPPPPPRQAPPPDIEDAVFRPSFMNFRQPSPYRDIPIEELWQRKVNVRKDLYGDAPMADVNSLDQHRGRVANVFGDEAKHAARITMGKPFADTLGRSMELHGANSEAADILSQSQAADFAQGGAVRGRGLSLRRPLEAAASFGSSILGTRGNVALARGLIPAGRALESTVGRMEPYTRFIANAERSGIPSVVVHQSLMRQDPVYAELVRSMAMEDAGAE